MYWISEWFRRKNILNFNSAWQRFSLLTERRVGQRPALKSRICQQQCGFRFDSGVSVLQCWISIYQCWTPDELNKFKCTKTAYWPICSLEMVISSIGHPTACQNHLIGLLYIDVRCRDWDHILYLMHCACKIWKCSFELYIYLMLPIQLDTTGLLLYKKRNFIVHTIGIYTLLANLPSCIWQLVHC